MPHVITSPQTFQQRLTVQTVQGEITINLNLNISITKDGNIQISSNEQEQKEKLEFTIPEFETTEILDNFGESN